MHVWGPTLEVCSNDSYENLTNVPVVFLAESQYCLNLRPGGTAYFVRRACNPQKERKKTHTAFLRAMEGNGGMYNVMAIISSIITTIKLKS